MAGLGTLNRGVGPIQMKKLTILACLLALSGCMTARSHSRLLLGYWESEVVESGDWGAMVATLTFTRDGHFVTSVAFAASDGDTIRFDGTYTLKANIVRLESQEYSRARPYREMVILSLSDSVMTARQDNRTVTYRRKSTGPTR